MRAKSFQQKNNYPFLRIRFKHHRLKTSGNATSRFTFGVPQPRLTASNTTCQQSATPPPVLCSTRNACCRTCSADAIITLGLKFERLGETELGAATQHQVHRQEMLSAALLEGHRRGLHLQTGSIRLMRRDQDKWLPSPNAVPVMPSGSSRRWHGAKSQAVVKHV